MSSGKASCAVACGLILLAALGHIPAGAGEPTALAISSTRHIESIGADVIPRDVVAAVTQDRHGFLWVATGDGLVRHDGIEFRPQELFNPDPALRSRNAA